MWARLFSMVVGGPLFAQQTLPVKCVDLTPGSQHSSEIEAGRIHCYKLVLDASQVIHLSLDQKGTDLSAGVRSPAGVEETFDTRWHGEERFAINARLSGVYTIRIGIVPDSPWVGKYTLKAGFPGAPDDGALAAARAGVLFTKVKERITNLDRSKLTAAAGDAEAALNLWRSAGDAIGEAQALNTLGYLRNYSGDREGAIPYFEQALEIWRRIGDLTGEGETRGNLASAFYALGRHSDAFRENNAALDLEKRAGYTSGVVFTLNNLANFAIQSGGFAEAIERCKAALAIADDARLSKLQIIIFSNLAGAYHFTGQYRDALDIYHRTLSLSQQIDRRGYAVLLNNIGRLHDDMGDSAESLRYFQRSREQARIIGDPIVDMSSSINIASVQLARGEIHAAATVIDTALSLPIVSSNPAWHARALLVKTRVLLQQGELDSAETMARSCFDRGKDLELPPLMAAALRLLGEIALKKKDYTTAIARNQEALAIWRETQDRNNEAFTLVALATAKRADGRKEEALHDVAAAVDLLESVRIAISAQDLQASLLSSRYQHFKLWIDLLMETGREREALSASERARARVLLDLLGEERSRIQAGAEAGDLARINKLTADINGKAFLQSQIPPGKGSAGRRAAAGKEITELLAQRRELENQLRLKSPRYASLAHASPVSAEEIQSLLDDQTALIEYSLDQGHSSPGWSQRPRYR